MCAVLVLPLSSLRIACIWCRQGASSVAAAGAAVSLASVAVQCLGDGDAASEMAAASETRVYGR